jgi:hypothetical protein
MLPHRHRLRKQPPWQQVLVLLRLPQTPTQIVLPQTQVQ